MTTLTRKCLYLGFRVYCVFITGGYIYGSFGSTVTLSSESSDQWENTDITLTCSYNGQYLGNFVWTSNTSLEYSSGYVASNCTILTQWLKNTSAFSYKCTNDQVHSLTLRNITQNRHGEIWRCANQPGTFLTWSNSLQIFVQVPVKTAAISSYTDILTTTENITFTWQCITSKCRPAPTFLWYKRYNTQSDAEETVIKNVSANSSSAIALESYSNNISIRLEKAWNGWYLFCGARNRNDNVVQSRQILINVTYPPDGSPKIGRFATGQTINVIKDRNVYLECSMSGGNPLPTLKWNEYDGIPQTVSGIVVTKKIVWQSSDIKDQVIRCESIHQHKNDTTFVIAHVLFPPDTLEVALNMSTISMTNIQQFFSVIENASGTMALTCSARSNPSPSSYWWTGPLQSNSARLELNTTRHVRGTYTCNVNNTMIAYDGHREKGYIGEAYTVEILQPPTIGAMQDYEVVEGNDFNIDCPIISGNDSRRSVKWLTNQNVLVGQNESLSIKNVTRFANGTYTCQLDFTMEPTYGLQKNDILTKGFYLAVLYKAEILSLSINTEVNSLTVNESARVHLACNVDSNPNSTIEIQFRNKSVSKKSNTRTLDYIIPAVNCNDTGTYVCSGNNTYNNGQPVRKDNTLFVICSPRQSPSLELKQRVIAALNDTATFYFTTMGYPLPSLQWYRVMNESEITEEHGGVVNTYSVSTNEMQSNLTLDRVKETQYGEYLLKINNQYGTFNQEFYLVAEGKPNPPKLYGYYREYVSSDSVTIWWEPGFDGGLSQSFIISYNLSVSEWYNETAIKHNKELRLNKTLTGLASDSEYHILIYAQNDKGAAVTDEIIVHTKELSADALTKPSIVGAAVGGVVGALLAIISVVVVVILVRKRSLGKLDHAKGQNGDFKDSHTYTNVSKEMHINTSNTDDKTLFLKTKDTSLDSPKLPERMPLKLAGKHNLQDLDDYDDKNERIYDNTYEKIKRIDRINVSELLPYLMNKPTDFFGLEFQNLPKGLTKPYEFSQKPENIAFNRYNGIYPYDHSRVKIPEDPTYFINACYINGYKKKKAFIASLGPLARTTYNFVTFWQMVWSEKSDVIVMLTKLKEPSGIKCDQYWPENDTAMAYGEITVTSLGEEEYSDYVLRKFAVSKGNKKRKLVQYHFMAWPDKSVPEDVTCVLEFRKRVHANHSSGPIIVHCSAGIGRTGTLIAIEILVEEGQHEGSVNVVECVKTMRDQRTSMVQTVDQYHYIYKALVNALVFDCESIALQKFPKYLDKTNTDQFNKMFQSFNQSVESDSTAESNARTANKMQRDKNRIGSDIPGDSHRVRLFLNRYEETSTDYINAVYIDSFTKSEHFVVAQSPMTNGVEDFLCMIFQVGCTCVVSLGDSRHGTNVGMFIPTDDTQSLAIGCFKVACKVLDTKDNYIIRKVKIEFKGRYEGGEKVVYHFEYNDWALGQKTPNDPQTFVAFTQEVEEFASQLGTGKSQVLVHCLNGFERSCLFCAVVTLVEKVKYEGEVCVPNVLRHIRARRKLAIPNMDQFQFCFKAVRAYISTDKTEPSIEEKAYINMALV